MMPAALYAVSFLLLAAGLGSARKTRAASTAEEYATWLAITGAAVWSWAVTAIVAGRL
jgi:hypothetical protein